MGKEVFPKRNCSGIVPCICVWTDLPSFHNPLPPPRSLLKSNVVHLHLLKGTSHVFMDIRGIEGSIITGPYFRIKIVYTICGGKKSIWPHADTSLLPEKGVVEFCSLMWS
ncbi:hypothetical protein CEXT_385781 [Caerostris extrusa]|uniref:Uncharacterized protein n=1 Tax=Caerostris extrusa TaxID=172846 RepID=A0AAV4WAZ2_CAEEX|nr:hypothetical protein CEXT_385781 [Caerostris extrusa]